MSRADDARLRLLRLREARSIAKVKCDRFDHIAKRHENGTAPVAVSSFNLFCTPVAIAQAMALMCEFQDGHRVLEPSAGTGRLLDQIPQACEVVAVEQDQALLAHLFKSYPSALLKAGDFLTRSDLGAFDRVLMNPPFQRGTDVRHIMHALTMLRPGGLLVSLCYDGTAQNAKLKPICTTWETLPAGSFRTEGTSAAVVLLTIKKDPQP
jgi:phospholipid N-methyltransferase